MAESTLLLNADEPVTRPGPSKVKTIAALISLTLMMVAWIAEGEAIGQLNGEPYNFTNMLLVSYMTRVGWILTLGGWMVWRYFIYTDNTGDPRTPLGAFTWGVYMKHSCVLGLTIFASTYTWYLSLPTTSLAGNSAVYQSAPVFVFLFSVPILGERVTALKVFAVFMCIGGSAAVAFLGAAPTMDPVTWFNNSIIDPNSGGARIVKTLTDSNLTAGMCVTACKEYTPPSDGRAGIGMMTFERLNGVDSVPGQCLNGTTVASCDAVTFLADENTPQTVACELWQCDPCGYLTNATRGSAEAGHSAELTHSQQTAGGYIWCLVSVILYAAYEVLYKKYATRDGDPFPIANSQRFFGMLGVAAVALVWPLLFVWPFPPSDLCAAQWPSVPGTWGWIVVVSVADTCFNVFLLITIVLTSPLFTAVGTILVIPLSALADYLIKGDVLAPKAWIGIMMILIGFFSILYSEHKESKEKKEGTARR